MNIVFEAQLLMLMGSITTNVFPPIIQQANRRFDAKLSSPVTCGVQMIDVERM